MNELLYPFLDKCPDKFFSKLTLFIFPNSPFHPPSLPLTDQSYERFGMFSLAPGPMEQSLQQEIDLLTALEPLAYDRAERRHQLKTFEDSKRRDKELMKHDEERYKKELSAIEQELASVYGNRDSTPNGIICIKRSAGIICRKRSADHGSPDHGPRNPQQRKLDKSDESE